MKRIALGCALAMSAVWGVSSAMTVAPAGKWSFEIVKDKMTDKSRGVALMKFSGGVTAGLIFKCDSKDPQRIYAEVRMNEYIGDVSDGGDYRDIDYRVDANAPQTLHVVYGDKYFMIPAGDGLNKFAADVSRGKHLVVRARNFKSESVETEFELGKATDAIRKVAAACHAESPV